VAQWARIVGGELDGQETMVMGTAVLNPLPGGEQCEVYEYKWVETNDGKELIAEYRRTEAW
jgi:hypothetical protein